MNANQPPLTLELLDQWEVEFPGDMLRGYRDGFSGAEWPEDFPSPAYEHGRRNGVNDRHHQSEPEMVALARARRAA